MTVPAPSYDAHALVGVAELVRGHDDGSARQLVRGDEVLAKLGQPGWLRIMLGKGQSIELADGTRWRLVSMEKTKWICLVVVAEAGGKVALAEPAEGVRYRISTRDRGYDLIPARSGGSMWRSRDWIMYEYGEAVATLTRRPPTVSTETPISLGAVFVALAAMEYGIPGEDDMGVPPLRWQ